MRLAEKSRKALLFFTLWCKGDKHTNEALISIINSIIIQIDDSARRNHASENSSDDPHQEDRRGTAGIEQFLPS